MAMCPVYRHTDDTLFMLQVLSLPLRFYVIEHHHLTHVVHQLILIAKLYEILDILVPNPIHPTRHQRYITWVLLSACELVDGRVLGGRG